MALKPLTGYSSALRSLPRYSTSSYSHPPYSLSPCPFLFLTQLKPHKTLLIIPSSSSSPAFSPEPVVLSHFESQLSELEDEEPDEIDARSDTESDPEPDEVGAISDTESDLEPDVMGSNSEIESDLELDPMIGFFDDGVSGLNPFHDGLLGELDDSTEIQWEENGEDQETGLSNSGIVEKILEMVRNLPKDVKLGDKLGEFVGAVSEADCVSLLKMLSKDGLVNECLYLVEWMRVQDPVLITPRGVLVVLAALGQARMSEEILGLVINLPQEKRFRDASIFNSAILGLAKCGRYDDAWQVYKMLEANNVRPDHMTSYILITITRKTAGKTAKDAWNLFQSMTRRGAKWSVESVSTLIKLFCQEGLKREALIIQSEMEKQGISSNTCIYNTLMDSYVKSREVEKAEGLFREMTERGLKPSVMSYNILMDAYSKRVQPEVVENLMSELRNLGLVPDVNSYTSLISTYGRKKDSEMANAAFLRMKNEGISPNPHAYTALVHAYSLSGLHEKAYTTYQNMLSEGVEPSVETYSTLLNAFRHAKDAEKVMEIWKYMMENKVEGTRITFDIVLDCLAKNGLYVEAREVIYEYSKLGLNPTTMTYNMLINAYGKGGQHYKIPMLLKEMTSLELVPDSITYLTIVHVFIRVGDYIKAYYFFKNMVKKRLVPDYKSCEKLRALLQNKEKTKNVRDRSAILGILNSKFVMERKRGKKDEFWKNKKKRTRITEFPSDSRRRYL